MVSQNSTTTASMGCALTAPSAYICTVVTPGVFGNLKIKNVANDVIFKLFQTDRTLLLVVAVLSFEFESDTAESSTSLLYESG